MLMHIRLVKLLLVLWLSAGLSVGFFGAVLSVQASNRVISGPANVLDGDTIEIRGTRIRLHGIDAAEGGQRCARAGGGGWDCAGAATARLRQLTAGQTVACRQVDIDRYNRIVAACFVGNTDVQEVLVREGLAWAYRQYSSNYVRAEDAARAQRIGIWQTQTMPPWDWRRQQSAQRSSRNVTPPNERCVIKGNINARGQRIYHTPQSPWYDATTVNESRGQRWFCSEAEARAAGWRPARW